MITNYEKYKQFKRLSEIAELGGGIDKNEKHQYIELGYYSYDLKFFIILA